MIQQREKAASGEGNYLLNRSSKVEIVNAVEKSEEEEGKTAYTVASKQGARLPAQRWIFAFMGCFAIVNIITMRVCLSLAITVMVKTKEISSSNSTSSDDSCPSTNEGTSSASSNSGSFEWDEYTQGLILSSFYWGYIVTQLPGGMIAEKFGGKYTLGLSILSTAILSLLTPPVVQAYDARGLIVLRILMGLCEGPATPAISVLIAYWAPPLERSKITSIVMSGTAVGTVVGSALSGVLIQASSIGWPIVFYVYGVIGILWFLAWVVLCYSRPEDHPFISETEQKYLQETINEHRCRGSLPIPWLHMMMSMSMWALVITKFGYGIGYTTMLTDLPKYMSSVLKFSIKANGFLSALPYVVKSVVSIASSWLVDWLIKTEKISRTNARKFCYAFCSVIPAVFIIAASYAGCDRIVVVMLFTIGVGAMGTNHPSIAVNPNDLSPNNAGTLTAMGNSVVAFAGILAPYYVGILTPNQTVLEWRIVFWITFWIFLSSTLIFVIWADGDVQYWNDLSTWKIQKNAVVEIRENVSRADSSDPSLKNSRST